jgi:ankyrin repeat protein
VEDGSFEVLEQILSMPPAGSPIETEGTFTPLMSATKYGRLDMCRILIAQGSSSEFYDDNGYGLLYHALTKLKNRSSTSIFELVNFLLENGTPLTLNCRPDTEDPILTLAVDVCLDNQKFVDESLGVRLCELLIKHGADINAFNIGKRTPLHRAAQYAYLKTMSQFLTQN